MTKGQKSFAFSFEDLAAEVPAMGYKYFAEGFLDMRQPDQCILDSSARGSMHEMVIRAIATLFESQKKYVSANMRPTPVVCPLYTMLANTAVFTARRGPFISNNVYPLFHLRRSVGRSPQTCPSKTALAASGQPRSIAIPGKNLSGVSLLRPCRDGAQCRYAYRTACDPTRLNSLAQSGFAALCDTGSRWKGCASKDRAAVRRVFITEKGLRAATRTTAGVIVVIVF